MTVVFELIILFDFLYPNQRPKSKITVYSAIEPSANVTVIVPSTFAE